MSIQAVADTHIVIWHLFGDRRLSANVRNYIELIADSGNEVGISAITLSEIVALNQRRRIHPDTFNRVLETLNQTNSVFQELPFNHEIAQVMQQIRHSQIPDLFDRMIAATAVHLNVPLITRDLKIRASDVETIW